MHLRSKTRRRGNILILFAGLMFTFMALAALAVDLGFAMLTQRQLTSATDTLALEAVRNSDGDPRDQAVLYGKYFDTFEADGRPLKNGAGPVINFSGGIPIDGTSFAAAQTYHVGNSTHLAANLQPNNDNNSKGDIVRGTFDSGSATFTADPSDATSPGTAFQVQLRRSNDAPVSGELSSGPSLPYFLGRGSLLDSSTKARGIIVRGVSVAKGQPAMSAGKPDVDPSLSQPLPGVTPFVLNRSSWDSLPANALIRVEGTSLFLNQNKAPDGYLIDPTALAIGQTAAVAADANSFGKYLTPTVTYGYVPIVDPSLGALNQSVIGFGYLTSATDMNGATQITKGVSKVAPQNASSTLALPLPSTLRASDVATLFGAFNAFKTTEQPLLSAALVR